MNEKYYSYQAPVRPRIRKLGTIACDIVEATPIVFDGRLYRLEYVRAHKNNEANPSETTHLRLIDVYSRATVSTLAEDHHFGTAFADGGYMYVAATAKPDEDTIYEDWGGVRVDIYRSSDLKQWELYSSVSFEGHHIFNTAICKKDGKYTMLAEIDLPVLFSFRFAQSDDMKRWEVLPEKYIFQKGRYSGGPAMYTVSGDPHYYVFYLEANPGPCYTNCIARSRDLVEWEYSPVNPVLMFDAEEDKKIANPFLTPHEQERIARALDINNSDMELCEFGGRTIIYYSWGCQMGIEFLAEACYEGSMKDFLQGFFERRSDRPMEV